MPVDLNGDGRLDLVALMAQQFETVVAYLNTGAPFKFTPTPIYTAPHPNWGSSGIELVDLDRDGDLDVLLTHGDTFDDQIIKPYHGIQWLENRGALPVRRAHPGRLCLASFARRLAIWMATATSMWSPARSSPVAPMWTSRTCRRWSGSSRFGLVCSSGEPWRRRAATATLDLGDADGDGDLDIVVGNFLIQNKSVPWVETWENQRNKPSATR